MTSAERIVKDEYSFKDTMAELAALARSWAVTAVQKLVICPEPIASTPTFPSTSRCIVVRRCRSKRGPTPPPSCESDSLSCLHSERARSSSPSRWR